MNVKTVLRYWFEWYTPALWAEGRAVLPESLPLSTETISELERLSQWHDTCMNWFHPPSPGPWKQEECDRFNAASNALYRRIREELGPGYEVINGQRQMRQHPDLDEYLRDPDAYILARNPWLKGLHGRTSARECPFGMP